jgi:hypothetical protein
MMHVRIVLVDNHPAVQTSLCAVLGSEADFDISMGEADESVTRAVESAPLATC